MGSRGILLAAILYLIPGSIFATDFIGQGRLFLGSTTIKPDDLNQEMTAQGLKEFSGIGKYGVEITYPVMKHLDVGINYSHRNVFSEEMVPNSTTNYEGVIDQDTVLLVARAPLYKTNSVRFDIFGGLGGSNTSFKIRSTAQNGELTRKEGGDWFASVATAFGASVGVGYNNVYFIIEGGIETNKVDSFKRSGTVNTNVDAIDLSGSYVMVGLMFDGIKTFTK